MWNQHFSLGVAQAVVYAPTLAVILLLVLRHGRPRMAWLTLLLFSMVRFVGGIIVVFHEKRPTDKGLLVTSNVLLGVGVFPLMLSTIGLVRIIIATDVVKDQWLNKLVLISRALFLLGVILIVVGGCLAGQVQDLGLSLAGRNFSRASYMVASCTVLCLIFFRFLFLFKRNDMSYSSATILKVIPGAISCLSTRITYACLSVFTEDPTWNPLEGSIGAFIGMALLQEYVIVILFIWVGFVIPEVRRAEANKLSA